MQEGLEGDDDEEFRPALKPSVAQGRGCRRAAGPEVAGISEGHLPRAVLTVHDPGHHHPLPGRRRRHGHPKDES